VTNNSFLDSMAFDGVRKHLGQDFTKIYHIDLKGNARTTGERRRKEGGNVFDDQIRVGVGISLFVRKTGEESAKTQIWIYSIDDYLKAREKQQALIRFGKYGTLPMRMAVTDAKHTWLTEGLHAEFETFIPVGNKEAKATKGDVENVVFHQFSNGVSTNRDAWVYNFGRDVLAENVKKTIDTYNEQVFRWRVNTHQSTDVDDFVVYDDTKIKWSSTLKQKLTGGQIAEFSEAKLRQAIYRPFTRTNLFFDRILNHRVFGFPSIYPTSESELENPVIWLKISGNWTMFALMVNSVPDQLPQGGSQCFPFYTYDEDGSRRRENVTDWALAQFRTHYGDDTITKWDIFHYVYGLLHHPGYRERYQANLKRELPRIPFAPDFRAFSAAGARLARVHVGYEEQPEYPLAQVETPDMPLDWRVEKMRLSKNKTQLRYNSFLTLDGIPSEVFNYRLGNRSALEWIIDQYRVKTDKSSGIVKDPNRADDPQYILRLIGKVISVSLETVEIVGRLPDLGVSGD